MSPAEAAALGLAQQALQFKYRTTRRSLKAESQMIRAQHKLAAQGIRADSRSGISGVAASANERGVLGSSAHLMDQEGVLGERDAALQAAQLEKTQGLLGVKNQQLANIAELRMGLANLALQTAAARNQASLDIYGGPTRKKKDYQIDTSGASVDGGGGLSPLLQKLGNRLPWAGIDAGDYRTKAEQTALWEDALKEYGDPEIADNWVARPGTSAHEQGWAIDVKNPERFARWVANHPKWSKRLYRPMAHEPWHWELRPGYGGR